MPFAKARCVKKQVFVSYAHADDEPFDEGAPGWVSFFVDKLKRAVARHPGGAEADFWMDHRLEPQRRVDDELKGRLRGSVVILSLISPRYIESEWCRKEMTTFVEEVGGGVSADRVFMVEVLPTEREEWHEAVRDLTPVYLWRNSLTSPEPKTLGWPVPDVRGDRDYWDEVNALASILARQLRELPPPAPATSAPEPAPPAAGVTEAAPAPAAMPAAFDAEGPLNVVIKADDPDQALASNAQTQLAELEVDGYLAPVMASGQNPAEFRKQSEDLLKSSHGVIVIYGAAPPSWVQAQYGDVRKLLALQRKGTWAGLVEAPPEPKAPHGLPPRGLMVLNCRQGIQKGELARFIQALRASMAPGAAGNGA